MAVHLSRWSQTLVGVRTTHLLFCCSLTQSTFAKSTLCNLMNYSRPAFPVLHCLLKLAQTHCPLNQWCHPNILSSVALSPFAFNLSQHQGLFQWAESSHQVAKALNRASASASVLPMNIQGRFLLGLTDFISLQSKGLSRVFSNTTVQKHPFLGTQPSLWSNTHICTGLLEKP